MLRGIFQRKPLGAILASAEAPETSLKRTLGPVQLTGLALTINAVIALNRSHPKIAALAFTFTLNLAARVHTTLEERAGRRRHQHWQAVGHSLTIAALGGVNRKHLAGGGVLRPGTYRLTLAPAGGATHSMVFKIG